MTSPWYPIRYTQEQFRKMANPGTHYLAYMQPAPRELEPDPQRQAAAERKRCRRRARNLGCPIRAGEHIVLDGTVQRGDVVLVPGAGWGFVNDDEVDTDVSDHYMIARKVSG